MKTAVLHVMFNPVTGPWSVIKTLAMAQEASGEYAGVGIGLITDTRWPGDYEVQWDGLPLHRFRERLSGAPYHVQYVKMCLRKPPVAAWAEALGRETGADRVVVHCHNAWVSGMYFPLGESTVPIIPVVTYHGVNADFRGQPVRGMFHRWLAGRVVAGGGRLTSVDAENLNRAESVLGMKREWFTVIPNGAPAVSGRAGPGLRGGGGLVVGHVGRLSDHKGWRIAFEAVERVRASGRDVRMVVAGGGPDAGEVAELAGRHGEWFRYLGHVSDPQGAVMPELDVMAMMSFQEGLPMSLIESFSVGLPVLATNAGGIREVIEDGVNGMLLERTVEALAGALLRVHDDRELLRRLSEGALASFEGKYDVRRIAEQYQRFYVKSQTGANI
jgi:glycosyltransferase involved in cell wall biosynthesis